MTQSKCHCWVAVLTVAIALAPVFACSAHADTVTDWNAIMQASVVVAPSNPNLQTRWGAIHATRSLRNGQRD